MKLERKILLTALISVVLAVPVSLTLRQWSHRLKVQKSQNGALEIKLQTKQVEIEQKAKEVKQEQDKNTDLQKQLETKRDTQAKQLARAQTAPVVVSYASGNCESYRGLVTQYSWTVSVAMAIMHAESGCNPNAISPVNTDGLRDHGLFQIHGEPIYDPAANVARAYQKYVSQGWQAWTVYNKGTYMQYL